MLSLHTQYELIMPTHAKIEPIDNEIGTIFKEENIWKISFKKLQTSSGKLFDEIHSGNTNAIVLPTVLPGFTFLRAKIKG